MDRQKYIGDISTYLSAIHYRLNDINKAGFFDINRCMETTFMNVLNIIYDYKLINLNTVHVGEPAIDLIDDEKHVCVQVTSTNTIQKVNGTLEKLKKTKRDVNDYRLIVLILKDEKKPRVNCIRDTQFKFDPEKDILTIASLISAISGLEIDKLKKLLICLKQEFGGTFNSNYIEDIEKIIGISSPFIEIRCLTPLNNDK